jgi:hypothetical protein
VKKCNVFEILVGIKRKFIEMLKPSDMKNHDGKSFTRKRSLTLGRTLMIILRCCPFCLQIQLDDFFNEIGYKEKTVSKQALSKSKTNLDPDIVKDSFLLTTKTILACDDIEFFKGRYRLCAIDGSEVALDNADELLEHFGGSGKNKDCAMAMASLCYDPLNNIILDGGLYSYGFSEREAAKNHMAAVSGLPIPKGVSNLYIADRGYPSKELFADMIDSDTYFFMRVRRKFNTDFDIVKEEENVTFLHSGKVYQVRVFSITLESGEKEILATNLSEDDLTYEEAGDLYFKRWRIEVKFDSLKNKLELENMSGRRVVTTYQDFWAKLDIANTIAALEYATDEVIEERTAESGNKYERRTNENRMITKFADKYIELLTNDNPIDRRALFDELVIEIAKRPVEVKPGRHAERKLPRKKKFCDRRKRALR